MIRAYLARIRFWLQKHPFVYDDQTGDGYSYQGYNIFRDEVRIRHSHHGYVTAYVWWSRESYLALLAQDKWDAV